MITQQAFFFGPGEGLLRRLFIAVFVAYSIVVSCFTFFTCSESEHL